MSIASLQTPSRPVLVMWAAGVCAAIALVLAVGTHRSSAHERKPAQETTHGWVRGLFANDELHHSRR